MNTGSGWYRSVDLFGRLGSLRWALVAPLVALAMACTWSPERAAGGDGGVAPPAVITGLTAIRITPTNASVVLDLSKSPPTQKFEAYGTINGREERITDRVSWNSERPIVAQIDRSGLATAGTTGGIVTLAARNGSVAGT